MNPSLYVSTYKKYSEGHLDGIWLNFDEYANFPELWKALAEFHSDEKQPEYMCQVAQGVPYEMPESVRAIDLLFLFRLARDEEADMLSAFLALDPGEAPELPNGMNTIEFASLFDEFKERVQDSFAGKLEDVTWTHHPDFNDWCFSRFLDDNPKAEEFENYLDADAIERSYSVYFCHYNGFVFSRH